MVQHIYYTSSCSWAKTVRFHGQEMEESDGVCFFQDSGVGSFPRTKREVFVVQKLLN